MRSACSLAVEAARSQAAYYRDSALDTMVKSGGGAERIMVGGFPNYQELAYGSTVMRHAEQYSHFTGWPFVAVNRIATRLASQKVKMGRKIDASPSIVSWSWDRTPRRKLAAIERMRCPEYIKSVDTDIELIESHPILEAIQNPNDAMTSWALLFTTVASFELTGRAYWWFVEDEDGKLAIWPVPSSWVTPLRTAEKIVSGYRVRPTGQVGMQMEVAANEMAYFFLPDPQNPLGAISPLQTQAPAVEVDEAIQSCQHRYFKNGMFPGVMLKAGRLPGMPGQGEGPRPVLTRPQRRELFEAVAAVYQSSVNYNMPFIVDGLIEGIEKFSQTAQEMDFIQSANYNKTRIFQAFGVNPFIAGEITGVNKAQAVVAESVFNTNVIGPIATLIGQVMTKHLGEEGTYFWLELPSTDDPDMKLRQWSAVLPYGVVTKGEYRQQVLGIPPAGDRTDSEYIMTAGAAFGGLGGFGSSGTSLSNDAPARDDTDDAAEALLATGESVSSGGASHATQDVSQPQVQPHQTGTPQEAGNDSLSPQPSTQPASTPPGVSDYVPQSGESHRHLRKGGRRR